MDTRATLRRLLEARAIRLRPSPFYDTAPSPGVRPWSRVEGMMLGLAIGDALGNTSESLAPSKRRALHGEIRDYLPHRWADGRAVGLPSDDTQMAFWTLEQALADGGLVPESLAERFARQRIFGIGATVTAFLRAFEHGARWDEAGQESAGNGALMRIAPVLIPHLAHPSPALWADTALAAMLTHNDTASLSSCLAFVALLWDLLDSPTPPAGTQWAETFLDVVRQVETGARYAARGGVFEVEEPRRFSDLVESRLQAAWDEDLPALQACERFRSGAYLVETVPCVLYLLMQHGHDPEEAVVRAVNDTGDNDTVAAIVGAAVGAAHGVGALPERWRAGLLGRTAEGDDGRIFELLEEARTRWASEAQVASAP